MLHHGIDLTNSVEKEHVCLKLVSALEVPTAEAEIVQLEDQKALVVKRFDRRWLPDGRLMRLPQEDCCQALSVPSTCKYQPDGGPALGRLLGCSRAVTTQNKISPPSCAPTSFFYCLAERMVTPRISAFFKSHMIPARTNL